MHPDLVPFLPIKTYGFCMALGFLAAWQVIAGLCRRTGRKSEPLQNLVITMMVSGIVGARAAYVIEHWSSEFAANPASIIRVDQGGLMFYGGLILAFIVFLAWCWIKRENCIRVADLFVVVIPLAHAFGRVGCFFYGCCYGRLSDSVCAVSFPRGSPAWYEQLNHGLIQSTANRSLAVLPTQLFEAAAVLALFAVLFMLYRRFWQRLPGLTFGCYFIGYACIRFGIEMLRGDPRAVVGPFSIGQTISLCLALFGIVFIAVAFKRGKL